MQGMEQDAGRGAWDADAGSSRMWDVIPRGSEMWDVDVSEQAGG